MGSFKIRKEKLHFVDLKTTENRILKNCGVLNPGKYQVLLMYCLYLTIVTDVLFCYVRCAFY